jgi:hypothetical protein
MLFAGLFVFPSAVLSDVEQNESRQGVYVGLFGPCSSLRCEIFQPRFAAPGRLSNQVSIRLLWIQSWTASWQRK